MEGLFDGHPNTLIRIAQTLGILYPKNDLRKMSMAVALLDANLAIIKTDMLLGQPVRIVCNAIRNELHFVAVFKNVLHAEKIYKFDKYIDTHVELRESMLHAIEGYL